LQPVHDYVVQFAQALGTVNRHLSGNYGESVVELQQLMLATMPSVVADPELKPFFDAMGVEVKETTPRADAREDEHPQDRDNASDEELVREMNVVWDAINRTLCHWMK
jgi:hypothetical protein